MDTLPNVNTRRGGNKPSHAGLTSNVSPKVQSPEAENSHTGVTSDFVSKANHQWFVLRILYGHTKDVVEAFKEAGILYYIPKRYQKVEISGKKRLRKDAYHIAELYATNAVNHQVANEPIIGKESIYKMFVNEFATAKMVCMVENIFEDGEWAIMEWKDSLGLRGCGFFHVKDNKIVFQRGYWDKLSFLKQHNLPIE